MKHLKKYSEYKDSGVEWIGEIPAHWKHIPLRWGTKIFSGGTPSRLKDAYWNSNDIPWLNSGEVNKKKILHANNYISKQGLNESSAKWIKAKSLIMALAGQGKTKGMVATLEMPSTCNQSLAAIEPDTKVLFYQFLYYYLDSKYQNIRGMVGDDARDGLNLEIIKSILSPLPPLFEQQQIANYLDQKTTAIDQLIQKKEQLIQLLEEKRTAMINQAVTKGLDPTVPMKDSGIEWLGEVPAHWEVKPLSRISSYISYGFTNPMPSTDEGIFMLTAKDINNGEINYSKARKTSVLAYETLLTAKSKPKPYDILITKDGTLGRVIYYKGEEKICISQSVALLRVDDEITDRKFVSLALQSKSYQNKILFDAGGTTIKHIYITRLVKMKMGFPPIQEQITITHYINTKNQEIDQAITKTKDQIKLLKEYKTTLISDVVTGKIDVREAVLATN